MFPKKNLEKLLQRTFNSRYSDFYRMRFRSGLKGLFPLTKKSWSRVPLLSREDLNRVPFWDRVFVSRNDVPFLRNTYGTSARKLLIAPRMIVGSYDDPYRSMGLMRMMSFFASGYQEFPRSAIPEMQVFFGDVSNLNVSARVARLSSIDSLYLTPYTALLFAPLLKKEGVIANIQAVQLCGERCSPLQYAALKKLYNAATVYGYYASSETREGTAIACAHDRARGGSLILEPMDGVYTEILSPETGEVIETPGVHGELVVTLFTPRLPLPLIRYRTGDVAVYVPRACRCEKFHRGFEILGRMSVFPVRLAKGELTVSTVEDALRTMPSIRCEYFEIHYDEVMSRGLPKSRVLLKLVPRRRGVSGKKLASKISERLKVFPEFTYADGVRDHFFAPLAVAFLDSIPEGPAGKPKSPIIVRHVAGSAETQTASVG